MRVLSAHVKVVPLGSTKLRLARSAALVVGAPTGARPLLRRLAVDSAASSVPERRRALAEGALAALEPLSNMAWSRAWYAARFRRVSSSVVLVAASAGALSPACRCAVEALTLRT